MIAITPVILWLLSQRHHQATVCHVCMLCEARNQLRVNTRNWVCDWTRKRQNKVNRWDGFIWLTAYWMRVRCTESRSWSDYTADGEAKAMLCSVKLDPKWAGVERSFPASASLQMLFLCTITGHRGAHTAACWLTAGAQAEVCHYHNKSCGELKLSQNSSLVINKYLVPLLFSWAIKQPLLWKAELGFQSSKRTGFVWTPTLLSTKAAARFSRATNRCNLKCVSGLSLHHIEANESEMWIWALIYQLFIRTHMVCTGGPTAFSHPGPWY